MDSDWLCCPRGYEIRMNNFPVMRRVFLSLLPVLYVACSAFAQSLLEGTVSIQERAEAATERFRTALAVAAQDPAKLTDGTLGKAAEQTLADLDGLDREVDSQLDQLSKKESSLASSGLSEADRKELNMSIAAQKKPLAEFKTKTSQWRKALEDFKGGVLGSWTEFYSTFEGVEGSEKARARLSVKVEQYVGTLPKPILPEAPAKADTDLGAKSGVGANGEGGEGAGVGEKTTRPVAGGQAFELPVRKNESPALQPAKGGSFRAVELPDVVASVNGRDIPRSELQEFFNATLQASGSKVEDLSPQQQIDGYNQLLQNLIIDKLVSEASSGVAVRESDVDAEVAKIKKQFPDEKTFDEQLQQTGQTAGKLRQNIAKMLAQQRWMQARAATPDISDADAQKFYNSNPKDFEQPETVRASHILFMVEEGASDAQVRSKRAAADRAADRAANGEDFNSLAKELSEEPGAAETGGDLGFFPKDRMVPEFAEVAFNQAVGVPSRPVKTQFGWHVVLVTDKRGAGTVPFAEVKEQITAYLENAGRREAEQEVIKKLRESARVVTYLPKAD